MIFCRFYSRFYGFLYILIAVSDFIATFVGQNKSNNIMIKSIVIPRLAVLPQDATAVPQVLDAMAVPFEPIATVNWPDEFPYCPDVAVRMAWCPEGIVLHYRVDEQCVRAIYGEDDGKVWTDSCVECFIRNAESDTYYNIECNCVGTLLIGLRGDDCGRCHLSLEVMAQVKRWASLGRETFGNRAEQTAWELALVIPASVFSGYPISLEEGGRLRANFYKCGDDLPVPHFVSWNPINVEKPNFHRPECFGELILG